MTPQELIELMEQESCFYDANEVIECIQKLVRDRDAAISAVAMMGRELGEAQADLDRAVKQADRAEIALHLNRRAYRKFRSGCCCHIAEDGSTILKRCMLHSDERDDAYSDGLETAASLADGYAISPIAQQIARLIRERKPWKSSL